jgi:pyruvate/2-oxoglutarate dehydrogenase complex dihydrolipoamide dehydrogenase (E3) component
VHPEQAFAWRDYMVSNYDDSAKEAWPKSKGIDVVRGSARIAGPGRVAVGDDVHTPKEIVIATGSAPGDPRSPGLRELEGVWTNREATAMTEVPVRLLVLGGGPVGVEMAQAAARMGASVVAPRSARGGCHRGSAADPSAPPLDERHTAVAGSGALPRHP